MTFRLLVFRPVVKELLRGRVKEVHPRLGVRVSCEFLEDVWVPPNLLRPGMAWRAAPPPSADDDADKGAVTAGGGQWFWKHYFDEDEAGGGGCRWRGGRRGWRF